MYSTTSRSSRISKPIHSVSGGHAHRPKWSLGETPIEMKEFIFPTDQKIRARKKYDHMCGVFIILFSTLGIFFLLMSLVFEWQVLDLEEHNHGNDVTMINNEIESKTTTNRQNSSYSNHKLPPSQVFIIVAEHSIIQSINESILFSTQDVKNLLIDWLNRTSTEIIIHRP